MKAKFVEYMTEGDWSDTEQWENVWNQLSHKAKAEYNNDLEYFMESIGRPLYEVMLECELDTKTNKVVILNASTTT